MISVGRTLSVWTQPDVQGSTLDLTYTVYNQQEDTVTDVVLETTLNTGVSFVDSTLVPVQHVGADLTWMFGEIAPFSHASVTVTVTLDGTNPLQLDMGSTATGLAGSTAISDDATPAVLRSASVDPALLASTPDANASDPFLQAKAAELNQDAGQIFEFVRDGVDFEAYAGSLRGSRGTLWSRAGNSLDQASLLVALLRSSGIPAQYAHGDLPTPMAQELILSMFPEPLRITGFIPDGTLVSDPITDATLLAETRDHFWVQFDGGTGMQDADPAFLSAVTGIASTAVTDTFAEVPDALRHMTTVRLNRELATPATSLLFAGDPLSTATVLEQTFVTAELAGKSLTIGYFVHASSLQSLFNLTTFVYAPYLRVSDSATDFSGDEVFRGEDFQEQFTSFPLGSQILTGLFLEVDVISPGGTAETVRSTIADRIGRASRSSGGQVSIPPVDESQPLVSSADLTSIGIFAGKQSRAAILADNRRVSDFTAEFLSDLEAAGAIPAGPERDEQLRLVMERLSDLLTLSARGKLAQLADASDVAASVLGAQLLVKSYADSPRVFVLHSTASRDAVNGDSIQLNIDLARNTLRAIAWPGQVPDATFGFHVQRGVTDTFLEALALDLDSGSVEPFETVTGVHRVFAEARAQEISFRLMTPDNREQLDLLELTPEIRTLLAASLESGLVIYCPVQTVTLAGETRFAWLEISPETGETIGRMENGSHGAFSDYATMQAARGQFNGVEQFALGVLAGTLGDVMAISFARLIAGVIANTLQDNGVFPTPLVYALTFKNWMFTFINIVNEFEALAYATKSFGLGFSVGIYLGNKLANDPPVDGYWISPDPLNELQDIPAGNGVLGIRAVPDPLFHILRDGAEVRSVFRLGIRNLSAVPQTYRIQFSGVAPGFVGEATVSEITVPAGETAEVGLAIRPVGNIGLPGTDAPFDVLVSPVGDPGNELTLTVPFVVPEIHGLEMQVFPQEVRTPVATPVDVRLILHSTANVPLDVTFAIDPSSGLTVSGVTDVTLQPGDTITQTVTLTPAADQLPHSELGVSLTASFGAQLPRRTAILLRVVVPGAEDAGRAAAAAQQLGLASLAADLDHLGIALTNIVEHPGDLVFKEQAAVSLTAIAAILSAQPDLSATVNVFTLEVLRDDLLAATTVQECRDVIDALALELQTLADGLTALVQNNFRLLLFPNTRIAQPLSPQDFVLRVQNTGLEPTTYDVSVSGIPAGVSSVLDTSQLMLGPGETGTATLTLTQTSADELLTFGFQFDVTTNGTLPPVSRSATATLLARRETVSVASVTTDPPFVDPGEQVGVSAGILNGVNRAQTAMVSYEVFNSASQSVFVSAAFPVQLSLATTLSHANLGILDTTGFAEDNYRLQVVVKDLQGNLIPGAIGEGRLLVGSPVTALLTVTPQLSQPGDLTVSQALNINASAQIGDPFSAVAQIPLSAFSGDQLHQMALSHGILYAFGDNRGVHVIDVTEPRRPQYLEDEGRSASAGIVDGNRLLTIQGGPPNAVTFFANSVIGYYDLGGLTAATPTNLNFPIGELFPNYQFAQDLVLQGNTLFVSMLAVRYQGATNDIFQQNGTVLSIDLSNPFSPQLQDVLFNELGGNAQAPLNANGGPYNMFGMASPAPGLLYVGSTTATGTDTQTGVGRLLVVDISSPGDINSDPPSSSKVLRELTIPGTRQVRSMTLDGHTAYVVASEGGWLDNFTDVSDIGPTGNIVLASIDVSDPANPVLIHSQTIPRASRGAFDLVQIGPERFAMLSQGAVADTPRILIVDASSATASVNPEFVVEQQIDLPGLPGGLESDGEYLYVTGDFGLLVYQINGGADIPVTASVQVPNGTGVSVVPGSFNVAPVVVPGIDFDTLQWSFTLDETSLFPEFTWDSQVTALQPGESRAVTLESTIDFTFEATADQITLPPQSVVGRQIVVGIEPDPAMARPGESVFYAVRFSNPFDDPANPFDDPPDITYDIALEGLPAEWISFFPSTVTIGSATGTVFTTITPDVFAAPGDYQFVVTARNAASQLMGSAVATLTVSGDPLIEGGVARGILMQVDQQQRSIGRGGGTEFLLTLINTGTRTETLQLFDFELNPLPGITTSFQPQSVVVAPGPDNARQVRFLVETDPSVTAGDYLFNPSVQSEDFLVDGSLTDAATLHILPAGVAVDLQPGSGAPGSSFSVTVTNTGNATDTFDLSVSGPAALAATLAVPQVTLAPGESQMVTIDVGAMEFLYPGAATLIATATSTTLADVTDSARADVLIADMKGLQAAFLPDTALLPQPGRHTFVLRVDNLGNIEDQYTASIIGTSGPVFAGLRNPDASPTQMIQSFAIPGLFAGAIMLDAELTGTGTGTVTVEIRSLTSNDIAATATATLETQPYDFGDAPDPVVESSGRYPTLLENNGARHLIVQGGPFLGTVRPDGEPDGQPNTTATGDDFDSGSDDEDSFAAEAGILGLTRGATGGRFTVEYNGGLAGASLNGWIDFNQDGDWDDVGEHILVAQSVAAGEGSIVLNAVSVPLDAVPGQTFARFRISTTGESAPTGSALDGEVEDFAVTILDGRLILETVQQSVSQESVSQEVHLNIPGLEPAVLNGVDLTDHEAIVVALTAAGVNPSSITVEVTRHDDGTESTTASEESTSEEPGTVWTGDIADPGNLSVISGQLTHTTTITTTMTHFLTDVITIGGLLSDSSGNVHGRKWNDLNGDGLRQPGEPWLNGWTIELLDLQGRIVQSTVTMDMDLDSSGDINPEDEAGWYWLTGILPGSYLLREQQQPEWQQTAPFDSLQLDVWLLDNDYRFTQTSNDWLNWGGLSEKWFYSRQGYCFITPGGSIYHWNGSPAQALTGTLLGETSPDYYQSLSQVCEPVLPAESQILVSAGQTVSDRNFGNQHVPPAGGIHGRKWEDLNGDGIRQSTEPWLNGWVIELTDSDGVIHQSAVTMDMDLDHSGTIDPETERGWYWLNDVPAGDYILREQPQAGWRQTAPFDNLALDVWELDRDNRFQETANDWFDWGGKAEKWFYSGQGYCFVMPNGDVFLWDHSPRYALSGTFLHATSPAYYADPAMIYNAVLPEESQVTVVAGATVEHRDFGNQQVASTNGSIQGRKFDDQNENGLRDPGESWLNGWTIELRTSTGQLVSSQTTVDVDLDHNGTIDPETERGWYWFDVAPGTWMLTELQQGGWEQTAPYPGADLRAWQLDQEYRFRETGNEWLNWGGQGEKWFEGKDGWYYITPAGAVFRWNQSPSGTLNGTPVGSLNSAFHADISRLTAAVFPVTSLVTVNSSQVVDGQNFGNRSLPAIPCGNYPGIGNIRVTVTRRDLLIDGDGLANGLAIYRTSEGLIALSGLGQTTLNGRHDAIVTDWTEVPDDVRVSLNAGNDVLCIHDVSILDDLTIDGGGGNDYVIAHGLVVGSNFTFEDPGGNNVVSLADSEIHGRLYSATATGNDVVIITQSKLADAVSVFMGAGTDLLVVKDSLFCGSLSAYLQNDADKAALVGMNQFNQTVYLDGGAATDRYVKAPESSFASAPQFVRFDDSTIPDLNALLDQLMQDLLELGLDMM
ncbi:MAG: hypothetical protein KDA96_00465 [Planctomycetaceae bacterium]|nr:hypothetical protein [Planctomycetaceae bacterium]